MTEDQIRTACATFLQAAKTDNREEAAAVAVDLLAEFLIGINRIGYWLEEIYGQEARR